MVDILNIFYNTLIIMSTDLMNIDGHIKRLQKETLTPYKIATVILIKEYCNETTKGNLILIILKLFNINK